jgi:hypothetical protein
VYNEIKKGTRVPFLTEPLNMRISTDIFTFSNKVNCCPFHLQSIFRGALHFSLHQQQRRYYNHMKQVNTATILQSDFNGFFNSFIRAAVKSTGTRILFE